MSPPEIAVIDSGINPAHPHAGEVAGGLAFHMDPQGSVALHPDFTDRLGHGTAIAGVVRHMAPEARLYAFKIFHEDLRAPASLLLAALAWAVDHSIKVVHLSLGVEDERHRGELEKLCLRARDKGLVVVASARSPDDGLLPASLETVVGACRDPDCDPDQLIAYPESPVEFGAYGYPRSLPGLPRNRNLKGHSFAAARVTGHAARILAEHPGAGPEEVKSMLWRRAGEKRFATQELS